MPPVKIEEYLEKDSDKFPTKRLIELAKRIGISPSNRQSRSALVNLISRHYEAGQMDLMIRSAKSEERRHKIVQAEVSEPANQEKDKK
ncbi:hypothetical protein FQZ97_1133900 [compost metagenome]